VWVREVGRVGLFPLADSVRALDLPRSIEVRIPTWWFRMVLCLVIEVDLSW
jgi:hypothetical protein